MPKNTTNLHDKIIATGIYVGAQHLRITVTLAPKSAQTVANENVLQSFFTDGGVQKVVLSHDRLTVEGV